MYSLIKYLYLCIPFVFAISNLHAQCYDLEIESGSFAMEPLALDAPNQLTYTICNTSDALPMDPNGGVRINFCPSVLNLLQVTQFTGSGLSYFQMGSFFNCSIAEQFTTIPDDTCFDFIVEYEIREESEIGEYTTDGEITGVHCISTNIIPSGILIGNTCNNSENDFLRVCSYSIGDTMVRVEDPVRLNTKNSVYPNPATDQIHLILDDTVERIEVYNIQGKRTNQILDISEDQLSVKEYTPGIYIFKFLDANSNVLSTQKLMILR